MTNSKVVWATDLHLDFALEKQRKIFWDSLKNVDKLIISGDIADGPKLKTYLQEINNHTSGNYYFTLGNHDYYGFKIHEVHDVVEKFCKKNSRAKWLRKSPNGFEQLFDDVAIVGNSSWYDCKWGTANGTVILRDFGEIKDFKFLPRFTPLMFDAFLNLAKQTAEEMKIALTNAFKQYDKVIAVMHVPPFVEAALYQGKPSNKYFLPFYTSKTMGDMLRILMSYYVDKRLIVLCGHTHGEGVYDAEHNIRVYSGRSEYFFPEICKEIDQSIWSW